MNTFTGLLNNAALMLVLCIIYDIFNIHSISNKKLKDGLTGVLVGLISIAVMLTPWFLQPGVFFDTRWVLLSLCGLFFGLIPTAIAVVIAGAFRLYQGGPGGLVGTVVIVVTACVGLAWKSWKDRHDKPLNAIRLYTFGVVVQLAMLSCMLLMSAELRIPILKKITLPILIIYPLLTLFIGIILRKQEDRRIAERELLYSTSLAKAALESTPDGILIVNEKGKIAHWNQRFVELWNVPQHILDVNEISPLRTYVASQMDDSEEFLAKVAELYEEPDKSCADTINLADGRIFNLYSQPQKTGGEIVGRFWSFRDITERKKNEKALQESNKLLAEIIDLSPISMAIVSMDGTIEHINRRAIETFGYVHDDIPDMERWWMLAYPDESYRAEVIAQWMSVVGKSIAEKNEIERHEYSVTCKDGKVRSTIIFGMTVSDKVFVIFDDITDRKLAEADRLTLERQLLHAQKLESLGILAGGIAHDFNNILTAIMGNISYARLDPNKSQHIDEPLARAEKAAKRAAGLAKQLLVFSKGGDPVKKPISLYQTVNEAVSLVLSGTNIKAVTDIPTDLHAVNADEGQISQAFDNIIINAVQAMPDGGIISISAKNTAIAENNSLGLSAGQFVQISFTDEGCGIETENLEKVFDPYFTNKTGGSGLGLASAFAIINKHGGSISVSSSPGKGAVFTILIPACGEPVTESLINVHAYNDVQGGVSILVMDDDEMVRELAEITLKRLGYKVVCCKSGAEAVSLYKLASEEMEPFSLVIMDLTIPGGMGGVEAARQVLDFDPKAKLVVSSGYSADPVMANFSDYGFCDRLEKPYNVAEIAGILQRCQ